MKIRSSFAGLICVTTLAAASTTPAFAGGVDAGTVIENTAQATFEIGGTSETISSNAVGLFVAELLNVTLTSLDGGPVTTAPGTAVLAYELTNTGNGPEAFRLTAEPSVGEKAKLSPIWPAGMASRKRLTTWL